MDDRSSDVIVLGAGPAGENAAARAIRGGLSATVVEGELVGGECSYWACIPSKALLRPVDLAAAASRSPGVRVQGIDTAAVLKRRDGFVHRRPDGGHDDAGQVRWLESVQAGFVRGHGRLAGERRVQVSTADGDVQAWTARHAVVVATGSTAALPDIPGLRDARPWTSREVTDMPRVPRRLLVLGGGVVAMEMAQAVKGLGAAEVTVLAAGRLLSRMEPWVGEMLTDALREAGVDVRTGTAIESVRRQDDGTVVVTAGGERYTGDEVLAALGRRPATVDIGLDSVGLPPGKPVEVDDTLRSTSLPWLYAVGDANGRALLTHQGKYQARVCGDVIACRAGGEEPGPAATAWAGHRALPQVVFTDPQCASVGLTEAEARGKGYRVRTVEYDIGDVAGASLLADGYRGRAAMVVDEDRRVLVGVTFVGQDVAELLHSATVAVAAEVPLETLWHAVPSYPTLSEVWLRLLETYGL